MVRRRTARTTTRRVTRGRRKGQTITVYVSSGSEVRTGKRGTASGGAFGAGSSGQSFVKKAPGSGVGVGVRRKNKRAALGQKYAKQATRGLKQQSHAKAGLHRLGKKGSGSNKYTDKAGNLYKRVGKGKNSKFVLDKSKPATRRAAAKKGRPVNKKKLKEAGRKGGKSRPSLKKGRKKKR